MRRLLTGIFVTVLSGIGIFSAYAEYKTGYYDRMDGKMSNDLKAAAKQCVSQHTRLDYYSLPQYWIYSDVYPAKYDGQTRWWDMYSDNVYLIRNGQSANSSFSANKMQREHSVPKSWWKVGEDVEYTPAYTDMWNLYPSDGPANQAKLNYPLGETRSTTFDNGVTKVGPPKTGQGGGSAYVFEPCDEYKGDFARSFFYMATVYDDLTWKYTYMFKKQTYPTLQPWAVQMLLQWSRQDPVSQKEIDRNEAVERWQGNRNPFIDFPELAEYIWGLRTTETFYIKEQSGQITSPITGDTEITQPVDGELLDFGQTPTGVAVNDVLRIKGKNLRSALSVSISGADKDYFSVATKEISPLLINENEYYDLPMEYVSSTVGQHEAKLVLYDGGLPDGKMITVLLRGETYDSVGIENVAESASDVLLMLSGGFMLSHDVDSSVVSVYDVSGRLVRRQTLSGGEIMMLPDGIYIVAGDVARRPAKMIISSN